MPKRWRGDVADVDVLVRSGLLVGAVLAWNAPLIAEPLGTLHGSAADGDDLRVGKLLQNLYHIVGNAAGAYDGPADGACSWIRHGFVRNPPPNNVLSSAESERLGVGGER